tara:strand:- start:1816 stop:4260 length:2445 start_codon:yes stop_codon:yes gene_type:complete
MGSSNILIKLVLEGFNKAKAQMNTLGKKTDESGGKLSKFGAVAKIGAVAVGTVLVKALANATRQFIDFEDKLNQSLAIMQTTEEQQLAMARASRQVAIDSRVSASESAEAFFFLASAGLDAEQSISALPQVTKFAQAGMFDMALATDLATDSQSALGLTVKDAEQNLTNLTRVTDVLVKANTLANASVQQFAEALTTKSGSALKVANKQIEEGVAVLSAFADRGVKGAEAGEKLNQLIRDTTRAVGKNANVFKEYNIDILDSNGNLKNLADVIEELDKGMAGMSDQQKAVLLDQLGLNRGVADAVKILSGAGDQIREYEQALKGAGGTTEDVADKQVLSLQGQIDILGSKFSEIGLLIVDKLAPALESTIGFFDKLATAIINVLDPSSEFNKTIEEGTKLAKEQGWLIDANTQTWDRYSYAQHNAEQEQQRVIKTHQEFADAMRMQDLIQKDLINNSHELDRETGNLNDTKKESIELTEEEIEAEKKLAKDRATAGLDALKNLNDAYQNLRDMEQDRLDLIDKEAQALTKLNDENEKLKQANEKVTKAKEDFEKISGLGAKVTNEEALAIAKQREEIAKLEAEEDKSEIQKLQLAVARERLNKIIEQSTAISREEEQALRSIEQAEADVVTQTDKVAQAQKKYQDAQEELAKATANSTENILEQAIAKQQLDEALQDLKSAEKFSDGINEMVRLVGGDLVTLKNQFQVLFNLSGRTFRNETMPDVTNKVIDDLEEIADDSKSPTTTGKKFDSLGVESFAESLDPNTQGILGTAGGSNVVITVNTGALLGSKDDVQVAVVEALEQAKRKGITVAQ